MAKHNITPMTQQSSKTQSVVPDSGFYRFSERQVMVAILTLATLLRLIGANSEFWFDEIVVVQNQVRLSAYEIVTQYDSAGHHVMNALLAHFSAAIWGEQPWAVRLPSILFGIAGVWAFYFLARQLWSRQIALLGTLMYAVSYHHVYYTQNARAYTALLFFALLASGLLLRLLQASTKRSARWYGVAYACAIGLGTYALVIMLFIIAGHGCVLLVARRWHALGWLLVGIVFALLLYTPMLFDLVVYYAQHLETGHALFSIGFIRELKPVIPLLLCGAVVAPVLLWRLAQRHPLAAALIVIPLVLNTVGPALRGQGLHPRSLIYGLPVAYFFLMEGLDWARLRFRWATWIAVGVVTVVSLGMLVRYYPLPKQGFQQALHYIAAHRSPNDEQMGLTLGGKAARFYDPSLVIIETPDQLRQWLENARDPTWVLFTFESELRNTTPELHDWLMTATTHQAIFPGVIGDGAVQVRLWLPNAGGQSRDSNEAGSVTPNKH